MFKRFVCPVWPTADLHIKFEVLKYSVSTNLWTDAIAQKDPFLNLDTQTRSEMLNSHIGEILTDSIIYLIRDKESKNCIPQISKSHKEVDMTDKTQQLRQLSFEILVIQIEVTFCDIEKLELFDLFNNSVFVCDEKEFHHKLRDLSRHHNIFDINQLKKKLTVIYWNDICIRKLRIPLWSVTLFHIWISEIFKLICLGVALPVLTTSTNISFSAFRRIG